VAIANRQKVDPSFYVALKNIHELLLLLRWPSTGLIDLATGSRLQRRGTHWFSKGKKLHSFNYYFLKTTVNAYKQNTSIFVEESSLT
jgi:hypothetical protein